MPGIPWWGAIVLAMTAAAVGFAFDAGSGGKTLSAAFSLCYAAGCVIAVLAVRQSGVFTAVIQPPLILFVTVPAAYLVMTGGQIKGIKDVLINCGYPLIERFPLMFFTSGIVLLIGMGRWFISPSRHRGDADVAAKVPLAEPTTTMPATSPRRSRRTPASAEAPEPRRKPARATPGTSRPRHNRPPDTELIEPAARGPRRPRSAAPVEPPVEPRRRIRSASSEQRRTPPGDRRNPYERPERSERPQRGERADRGERRHRSSEYDQYDARTSNGSNGRNGADGTHHPVSRVRYRASDDGEPRHPQRSRPRDW